MELLKARRIAEEIKEKLAPYCSKIEIAGSIRRRRPVVNDIDIVCIPSSQGKFAATLQELGKIKVGGSKVIRVGMGFTRGIDLDIYIATPETWATLLLIRTGSTRNNVRLCTLARQKGMVLHADGSGLFKIVAQGCEGKEERIAGDTEESIFETLGLKHKEPWERE
jgi:DNA polymerase (family 10)